MAETPTYVYGITAAGNLGPPLRAQGLPDGQSPVTAVAIGGAAAIVGRHEGPALSALPHPELLRRLAIHQRVAEDAMRMGDLLPVQFGTVLASQDEVRMLLTCWGGLMRASLERFAGLVEMEVAASWDLQQVLGDVASDPEVMAAKSAIAQVAPQEQLTQRINVGKTVKEALDRRRSRYQGLLLESVGTLAERAQPNILLSDELVFNVAFLLPRRALAEFDAAMERLDAELAGPCRLRVIGPLPPYTFGTVRVTRFDAERLAVGRALLGLAGEISEQQVQARYRELARQFHPDRQPAADVARFAALTAARADLLAYVRGRGQASAGGDGPALVVTVGQGDAAGAVLAGLR